MILPQQLKRTCTLMKLSILDPSPIAANQTPQNALYESVKLAQLGEAFGYTRFWMTEHHDLTGLASSAPEVMLSYIGAHTKTIRLGTGAVLLPFYQPYKVAEVYHTLAGLLPGRIDVGLGRAPGGSVEATNALSDHFLQQVWKMPELVKEFVKIIDHDHADLTANPVPDIAPIPWILGTSKKSGALAAENGMAYAFGHFMSENDGVEIIKLYLDKFKPRKHGGDPQVIVTVSVICAETKEEAEGMALSSFIWSLQKETGGGLQGLPSVEEARQYELKESEKEKLGAMKQKAVIGDPKTVKLKLIDLQNKYRSDELMIITSTHCAEDRKESYRLIAKELLLNDSHLQDNKRG